MGLGLFYALALGQPPRPAEVSRHQIVAPTPCHPFSWPLQSSRPFSSGLFTLFSASVQLLHLIPSCLFGQLYHHANQRDPGVRQSRRSLPVPVPVPVRRARRIICLCIQPASLLLLPARRTPRLPAPPTAPARPQLDALDAAPALDSQACGHRDRSTLC